MLWNFSWHWLSSVWFQCLLHTTPIWLLSVLASIWRLTLQTAAQWLVVLAAVVHLQGPQAFQGPVSLWDHFLSWRIMWRELCSTVKWLLLHVVDLVVGENKGLSIYVVLDNVWFESSYCYQNQDPYMFCYWSGDVPYFDLVWELYLVPWLCLCI